ncbi:MAG: ABC transporter permease subunit [Planctomycetes bacterium]|jgi:NitT/TauT family transport system permease protein|nr:ABC transporter permease subunit [Planctomycetota bacterium]
MPRARRILTAAILPGVLLVIWAVAAARSPIVPGVGEVLGVLTRPFRQPPLLDTTSLAHGTLISVLRVAMGFGLAVLLGVPLGVWMGLSRTARDLFAPMIALTMAVSPIAWLPIAIIVFGLSSPASVMAGDGAWQYATLDRLRFAVVAVITLGSIWPIILNTAGGVRQVRESYCEHVRLLGGGRRDLLRYAVLPGALPSAATGLRLGAAISWRVIVAAEIFPGTRSGLGAMIATAHEVGEYQYAFAAIGVIAAIGLLLDGGFRLLEERLSHWRRKER